MAPKKLDINAATSTQERRVIFSGRELEENGQRAESEGDGEERCAPASQLIFSRSRLKFGLEAEDQRFELVILVGIRNKAPDHYDFFRRQGRQ
ncbi:hypothetical protein [Ensifer sp. B1-9]|uniref:hypothetical protein n=1 Tax=Ensifer sp. B1-9 TaxID=3141455 RepID=UPI003D22755C